MIKIAFPCLLLLLFCGSKSFSQQAVYRDLNKNGKMDDYENVHLSAKKRAANLLSLMTTEEKAGEMFHTYAMIEKDGNVSNTTYMTAGLRVDSMIINKHMSHFNIVGDASARSIAHYNNLLQKLAEGTRLGIPVTLSTDPRNSQKASDLSTAVSAGSFSAFPEPIGFAAVGDTALMYQFGKIAAQEYRAVGIVCALHPMADLATEPRWSRISGTFGEDAGLAAKLITAYIQGFQGKQLDHTSVMCVTKHFPGSGPESEGWEGHFSYGRNLVYPGNNLDYHLIPFKAAIKAGTAGVMTAYGIPSGQTTESVGGAFNKQLIMDVLKKKLGFKGLVVSDWNTLADKSVGKMKIIEARGWGVEELSRDQKITKEIMAGVDQIGGETETVALSDLINNGKVPVELINASVLKILELKFELGLFDNPYVDENKVEQLVGTAEHVKLGLEAQQRSLVLLTNKQQVLPLKKGLKVYAEGFDKKKLAGYVNIVDHIQDADLVILHLHTPYSAPPVKSMMDSYFHQGRLDFDDSTKTVILDKLKAKPAVVVINLERPAVIPEIVENALAVLADFNVDDQVILSTLFGQTPPSGKLPYELPSSMKEVQKQKEDVPYDTHQPLFRFGYGLTGY